MRSGIALRLRQAKPPDMVLAVLVVFIILLIGLLRAIDALATHAGGALG